MPAVHLSGSTRASALMTRSQSRWIWLKRASAAAGEIGLKIEPSGDVTLTGRNDPSFWGMYS